MKQTALAFLIGWVLLFWPWTSYARESRVYIGFSVGTAIVVGSGIASFNIGYNQQVKREPEPRSSETAPPPALAELSRKGETEAFKPFPDFRINSQSDPPQPLRFEFPFFILRW